MRKLTQFYQFEEHLEALIKERCNITAANVTIAV